MPPKPEDLEDLLTNNLLNLEDATGPDGAITGYANLKYDQFRFAVDAYDIYSVYKKKYQQLKRRNRYLEEDAYVRASDKVAILGNKERSERKRLDSVIDMQPIAGLSLAGSEISSFAYDLISNYLRQSSDYQIYNEELLKILGLAERDDLLLSRVCSLIMSVASENPEATPELLEDIVGEEAAARLFNLIKANDEDLKYLIVEGIKLVRYSRKVAQLIKDLRTPSTVELKGKKVLIQQTANSILDLYVLANQGNNEEIITALVKDLRQLYVDARRINRAIDAATLERMHELLTEEEMTFVLAETDADVALAKQKMERLETLRVKVIQLFKGIGLFELVDPRYFTSFNSAKDRHELKEAIYELLVQAESLGDNVSHMHMFSKHGQNVTISEVEQRLELDSTRTSETVFKSDMFAVDAIIDNIDACIDAVKGLRSSTDVERRVKCMTKGVTGQRIEPTRHGFRYTEASDVLLIFRKVFTDKENNDWVIRLRSGWPG